jgi:hypothetical protein
MAMKPFVVFFVGAILVVSGAVAVAMVTLIRSTEKSAICRGVIVAIAIARWRHKELTA